MGLMRGISGFSTLGWSPWVEQRPVGDRMDGTMFLFLFFIQCVPVTCITQPHPPPADTHYVAVSSNIEICGFTCDKGGSYWLIRSGRSILEYICKGAIQKTPNKCIRMDVSSGCCNISNAQKSDSGVYTLEYRPEHGDVQKHSTTYKVIGPVFISNITSSPSDSGEKVTMSVWYSGEEATVTWTWNGGSLSERHQLGDGNKTLTVPSTDTGIFSVCVTNPVGDKYCSQYTAPPPDVKPSPTRRVKRIGIIGAVFPLIIVCMWIFKPMTSRYVKSLFKPSPMALKSSSSCTTCDTLCSCSS
ncbi:hypothetical protein GDO86_020058 [Hymenochirus boettgeri]|uniref:Ig-like domain-containing protein n=1 Tax=Hymenochirus boettgeri TaxID=247094 RepID=A0A8T2ICL2_9PIPI|nr:hypothetical protein GDO86_020058 [Hymenochirus boettgeri]